MRIKTGIIGFDTIIGGGYRPNTVNIVVGASGTGKTIFSLQFLLKGIENGEKGIYVSFDMDGKAIMVLAESLGWYELVKAIEDGTLLVTRSHADSISYLNEDIIGYIENNSDGNARIVIDSFTPLISSLDFTVRKDINWFFDQLRASGTSIVTVEEPFTSTLSKPDVALPIFLGDSAVYLKNIGYGEAFSRTIQVIKHRASWHADGVFPYRIFPGLGIVVESDIDEYRGAEDVEATIKDSRVDDSLRERLRFMIDRNVPVTKSLIERVLRIYESESK
ncbi:RAD55 family ATPase [Geoglobus acetivorans]|uniref:ATPase RecA-superfamily n=1 Tax=Geoglobus acetivorans TaxID=565033 RepID=A0A0A7GGE0_GEOAI|nr:ATPase RecA-superfamily [Geoglobus acetivorans]